MLFIMRFKSCRTVILPFLKNDEPAYYSRSVRGCRTWSSDWPQEESDERVATPGASWKLLGLAGRQMYGLLRSIWQSVLGRGKDGQQMGQVNVRDPNSFGFGVKGAHRLAAYIAKYCGKAMACRELNQKRYFRSRGLVVPEVQCWRLPNCTCMLDAVHAAFRAIEGHAMENLITWCNNEVGVNTAEIPHFKRPINFA